MGVYIDELAYRAAAWHTREYPDFPRSAVVQKLIEEVGEFAREDAAVDRLTIDQTRELADVLICILVYATRSGMGFQLLLDTVDDKLTALSLRPIGAQRGRDVERGIVV